MDLTKLSEEDKERMVKESEKFAEEDKKKRDEAEILNNADSLIYTAEKTKKDLGDKLTKEQIGKVDKAVAELRKVLGDLDNEIIKSKSEELAKALQEVGTAAYQQAAAKQAEAKDQGQPTKDKEKVVDADFEEVKEETEEKKE